MNEWSSYTPEGRPLVVRRADSIEREYTEKH